MGPLRRFGRVRASLSLLAILVALAFTVIKASSNGPATALLLVAGGVAAAMFANLGTSAIYAFVYRSSPYYAKGARIEIAPPLPLIGTIIEIDPRMVVIALDDGRIGLFPNSQLATVASIVTAPQARA